MGETLLEHSFLTSSMVGLGLIDTTLGLFIGSVTASDKSSRVLEENVVSSCFTLVLGTVPVLAPLDFFTFMSGGCSRSNYPFESDHSSLILIFHTFKRLLVIPSASTIAIFQ